MQINSARILQLDFLSPAFKTVFLQKLPGGILVFLVILLSTQIAKTSWTIVDAFYSPSLSEKSTNIITQKQLSRPKKNINYQALSNMHLFGSTNDGSPVIERGPVSAPETRLNLILYGVFAGDSLKQGSAIIGSKKGVQKHYKVNDKLDTGVWLAEVRKDHVLLKRGGNFELLKFPKQSSAGVKIQQNVIKKSAPIKNFNKQSFMDSVRIVPVFAGKGRGLKGYRILPKKNRELYNRLGLRPSDIITKINGISLSNEREAMKVIGELVKSDQVDVQLERSGQIETMSLNLK